MEALTEAQGPVLQMTVADRLSCRDKKNIDLSVRENNHSKPGTLYRHLDLERLIDVFATQLMDSVPIDSVKFNNTQLGQVIDKSIKDSKSVVAHKLEYRVVDNSGYLGNITIARDKQFLSAELRRINSLVEELVGPLRNASMYWRACRSAYLDALTGVPNRAALDVTLSSAPVCPDSAGASVLMVCDVDCFKSINDNCGHAAGDEVLCEFAGILRSSIRKHDRIHRYGGDEFVIVSNCNTLVGATDLAERIRESIKNTTLSVGSALINLTTTIGLTSLKQGESFDEAFLRADEALLIGKRNGKNQVVCR